MLLLARTETYEPVEKERVQALNDFLVFGFVAFASFMSGNLLVSGGWNAVNLAVLPIAIVCLAGLGWLEVRARKRAVRDFRSP